MVLMERGFDRMKLFDTEVFDISTAENPLLTDLCDLLMQCNSDRSEEQKELDEQFADVYSTLRNSLTPEQRELFDKYQEEVEADEQLTGQHQFICGFKLATRLFAESMK